ncbi:nicotinamide riboside transporter PnuC [Embleya sp. NPDC127516]|uniref:nicotinamide mononucleotide transporter family protein n=1 Tax=Embleya sp. NPDC127516 TaxID=3363990 RepID=UPI00380214DD
MIGWLNDAAFTVADKPVPWSDLLGQIASLATVGLALRRNLWAWPVQILGAALLIAANTSVHLGGSAMRNVVIIIAAGYGWWRWARGRRDTGEVQIRFGTAHERIALLAVMAAGTVGFALLLERTGISWAPWPDAYIFVGSVVAMLAQARGLFEFWLVWIAVDMVGVPLAVQHGLVFSGLVYGVFFVMCVAGLVDWWNRSRRYRDNGAARVADRHLEGATA